MIQLALLRHGEVQGGNCYRGSTDDPLTDTGLNQMRTATQEYLAATQGWNQIISSPLKRCASFAREFAEQHALPVSYDNRLREIHFGDWEGRTAAELFEEDADALTQFWADPFTQPPPQGEPFEQFQSRVLEAWNSIVQKNSAMHNEQRILLVTHGGVIRMLLCYLQQRPLSSLLDIEVKHGALYTVRSTVDAAGVSTFHTECLT